MRCVVPLLLFLMLSATARAQVARLEYFIDIDPGAGRGLPLAVSADTNTTATHTLPLSGVSAGYHIVYLRVQDAQGRWSQTMPHPFYTLSGKATAAAASEYFIDTDPGYGSATPLPLPGADSSVTFVVPLSGVSTGFHILYVRSTDDAGSWSITQQHFFLVREGSSPVNIVSLEYFFTGNSQTSRTLIYTVPNPAPIVDLNFTADLSQLEGDREYDMHAIAVAGNGMKSDTVTKRIKVCSGQIAKAAFGSTVSGREVAFVDSSEGAGTYTWEFGDGSAPDTASDPVHTYTAAGQYTVRLIVQNFCSADTALKSITVSDVSTAVPDIGISDFGFRVFPNPTESGMWFEFTLPATQQVRLTVTDMTGKQLGAITEKLFTRGTHKVFYNLQHLQAGFYIGELQTKRYKQSIKIFKK